ncbi:Maf-like protein [Acinetobacter gyllenbergii]|uniref:Nucleoside triphosphate pyrophosphatase n=1 Tax=Acinetobacter gyllenbergii CIP 110306 = MTCC 11365 TaxID=1217657 RepID=A0A829HGE7_9GAMM|nr:Maf family protein [Acinetobacter gyllenbergii]EPF80421.1 maf-like protein [Acinetobacter gyllenbergii CIP 110306 = MTCC 11365]EPH34272.1 Maf/YceF/YhdE family protein [Acinetobacter gyllenbergii CIP 110306 = MTCC 11365]GMA12865.1 Maf-like protein [Acinetobacter gyllenbergii]
MYQPELILASSSQTRKDLMDRLRLDYRCISPDIDESADGEVHADDLAKRLAYEKARVIAQQHPDAIVIGSDQVAWREHAPYDFIGKPLSLENAIQQLQANSSQTVFFSTALSVQHLQSGFETTLVEHYQVKFRQLTLAEIERYIAIDQPLHCAGSFKCESLGISLFEKMVGDDQTTLMGLPMIQLCKILRQFGISAP